MAKSKRYTDQEFIEAVKSSISIAQVLLKLSLKPAGGNYKIAKLKIKALKLDTSHFKGQAHNKGKTFSNKSRPVEDYLSNKVKIQSHQLRLKLIKENIFEEKCYSCNLSTWQEKSIPLELEHINGDHFDNSLNNLLLLCPNCHAQTPTYRGKNKGKY